MKLTEVQVKVGVIEASIYDDYKFCDTPEKKMAFLEKHKFSGTLIYENLQHFRDMLNGNNLTLFNRFIDFIPYEGWL